MENNRNNKSFMKGALAGALAMFCLALVLTGALKIAGMDVTVIGTRNDVVNGKTEKKLNRLKKMVDRLYLYSDDVTEEEMENGLYSGYIRSLGDPYSVYYDEEDTKKLKESTAGEYYGIGVVFSQNQDTKVMTAVQVYKNSPAKEAGIREGDILYKVDGDDVTGKDLSDVVQDIRGTENTTVEISVLQRRTSRK